MHLAAGTGFLASEEVLAYAAPAPSAATCFHRCQLRVLRCSGIAGSTLSHTIQTIWLKTQKKPGKRCQYWRGSLPTQHHWNEIRGMSIDQAIAQLEFNDKKGAKVMKEVLLEAQDLAVRNHHVEYRSNLYIAESFSNKGTYLKRIRYHARGRFGIMDKVHCHYFVKLVEGPPPPKELPITGFDQAKDYVQQLRNRTIIHSL
ncbi:hypothetical protein AB205_0200180 [Aquarana catesbeiana]|uniref:Large ribosomal subunit protein uL22m n=1 Tax=Aquarana catesbeiana TaxID=8400 RepID=A0A2G9RSI8_AQUCT|nr:hypothetical protein AB205_0200180 [Aquarana catesbeiana]